MKEKTVGIGFMFHELSFKKWSIQFRETIYISE